MRSFWLRLVWVCGVLSLSCCAAQPPGLVAQPMLSVVSSGVKVVPSPNGIYHGVYPDIADGVFEGVGEKIDQIEGMLKRPLAFVSFDNDFVDGFRFPDAPIREILIKGKTPLIRMLPRSTRKVFTGTDPVFSLERFVKGDFDGEIRQWARDAKATNAALMVEFGPECNGKWFQWSGDSNGGETPMIWAGQTVPTGPTRFKLTFQRIVALFRQEHAHNITWVFHGDSQPIPEMPWNNLKFYYPGDDYIDWLGITVYGAQLQGDWWGPFTETLDARWAELTAVSATRPVILSEWGVIEKPHVPDGKADWIEGALRAFIGGRYPQIKAINYYHFHSENGGPDNNFALDTSMQSLERYNRFIADPIFLSRVQVQDFR
ncbi:MAG: hypothetical protein HYZ71_13600 [Deltaproteobacteria bacterium]|nr:hypothetical protein [Deltaproteobacteria bacterium]